MGLLVQSLARAYATLGLNLPTLPLKIGYVVLKQPSRVFGVVSFCR